MMIQLSQYEDFINEKVKKVKKGIEPSLVIINQNLAAGLISKVEYFKQINALMNYTRNELCKVFPSDDMVDCILNQMFV